MRLGGDRTGKRVVVCEQLELHGLTDPFDAEIWFGERVAVLGPNGTGKSHFLRLLAGESVDARRDVAARRARRARATSRRRTTNPSSAASRSSTS